ncbi:MAG: hypothetical protein KAR38_07250, partial [Calditrichia bacterium]|nr:hypothetical protein [Calditrichia bacterium]
MNRIIKIKYVLFFIIVLLLTSCNSARTKVVKTNHKTNSKINAPEWFKTPPSAKNYLFAVSTARSTHADYAINKGLQNAYAEMSRIVQSHLDGVVLHLVEEYGNDYYSRLQSASQLVSKNTIAGIRVVKQEIIQQGPYYYTFFLAAIPVSGVNSSFKKKLSEIVGLNTNASSSKIFAVSNKNTNLLKMTNLHKISGSHSYPEWFLNE